MIQLKFSVLRLAAFIVQLHQALGQQGPQRLFHEVAAALEKGSQQAGSTRPLPRNTAMRWPTRSPI